MHFILSFSTSTWLQFSIEQFYFMPKNLMINVQLRLLTGFSNELSGFNTKNVMDEIRVFFQIY